MLVDVLDPGPASARTLVLGNEELRIAALFDGRGDWGSGVEAADLTREALVRRWSARLPGSADQIATDLREAVGQIPPALNDQEWFGMSFSAVVLLCRPHSFSVVASGRYAARFISDGQAHFLFRPRRLADDLILQGVSVLEVAAFPHRDVFTGPALGGSDELTLAHRSTGPRDRVIVSDFLHENPSTDWAAVYGAAAVVAAGNERAHLSPTIVVSW